MMAFVYIMRSKCQILHNPHPVSDLIGNALDGFLLTELFSRTEDTLSLSLSLCRRLKDKHSAMPGVWSQWFRSSSLESVRESETYRGLHWIITHHTNTFRWFIVSCVSVRARVWEMFTYRNVHISPRLRVNSSFPAGTTANNPNAHSSMCSPLSEVRCSLLSGC